MDRARGPRAETATMPSRSSMLLHHHAHELLGPRPAPLKVATANQVVVSNNKKRRRPEQPVIIYVESPKVVHAHPSEFKSVVQRLTGAPPPPPSSAHHHLVVPPPALHHHHHHHHQFPFQLYEQLVDGVGGRLDDDRTATTLLPLLVSTSLPPPPPTVLAADHAAQQQAPPPSSSLPLRPADDDQLLPRPAAFPFLFDRHHSNDMVVTVAANTTGSTTSNHQLQLVSADPFLPSSLGASYHGGGDLFVNQ